MCRPGFSLRGFPNGPCQADPIEIICPNGVLRASVVHRPTRNGRPQWRFVASQIELEIRCSAQVPHLDRRIPGSSVRSSIIQKLFNPFRNRPALICIALRHRLGMRGKHFRRRVCLVHPKVMCEARKRRLMGIQRRVGFIRLEERKICSAAANRKERNRLSRLIGIDLLNRGVAVEAMDHPRLLFLRDRPNLRPEPPNCRELTERGTSVRTTCPV